LLAQQRGRADQEPGPVAVDVVVHELDAEHADAHHRQLGSPVHLDVLVSVAPDADTDALADVQVQDRGRLVGGHHLVGPRRVGGPALDDLQPVLVGEQSVRAGDELHLGLQDRADPPARRQRHRVELLALLGAAHVRQPGQLVHQAGVGSARLRQHEQVGRVRAG
jgi:hypothetical protein